MFPIFLSFSFGTTATLPVFLVAKNRRGKRARAGEIAPNKLINCTAQQGPLPSLDPRPSLLAAEFGASEHDGSLNEIGATGRREKERSGILKL